MILDELVDDLTRMNRNEIRIGKVSKDVNIDVGGLALQRVTLTKSEHYDRRMRHNKLVVYKSFENDDVLQSFIDRVTGVDRESANLALQDCVEYAIANQFGVEQDDVIAKFDLRAGCSMCTCSPGWIVEFKTSVFDENENSFYPKQYDMWLTFA